jgi:UDP-2,3-diacylglucosamine hydrolase
MAIHFISDLHLSEEVPTLNRLFADTLAAWRGRIDALYILGDLFEYWVGDDDNSPFIETALAQLASFAAATPLFVMHGNRDFLLGEGFCRATGAKLLADPTELTLYDKKIVLAHGDALCTGDAAYQQFRQMARNPAWQQGLLAKSLAERHAMARQIRSMSEGKKQETGLTDISDVASDSVVTLLEAHPGAILIHGHTHRPAHHVHELSDGQHAERWVIQDWHGATGGYLKLDETGISAHPLG